MPGGHAVLACLLVFSSCAVGEQGHHDQEEALIEQLERFSTEYTELLDIIGELQVAPFKVSAERRTVSLVGYDLIVTSGSDGNVGHPGNVVVGGEHAHVEASNSLIAGSNNEAVGYSTVVFGYKNSAQEAMVLSGMDNVAAGGGHSSVCGGASNKASGSGASMAGGKQNEGSAAFVVVAGGTHNFATRSGAVVTSGSWNMAEGLDCTVIGGYQNIATGTVTTLRGGHLRSLSGVLGVWEEKTRLDLFEEEAAQWKSLPEDARVTVFDPSTGEEITLSGADVRIRQKVDAVAPPEEELVKPDKLAQWKFLPDGTTVDVVDDPSELKRLCLRPAPGAEIKAGWDAKMEQFAGQECTVMSSPLNPQRYGTYKLHLAGSAGDGAFEFPHDAVQVMNWQPLQEWIALGKNTVVKVIADVAKLEELCWAAPPGGENPVGWSKGMDAFAGQRCTVTARNTRNKYYRLKLPGPDGAQKDFPFNAVYLPDPDMLLEPSPQV